MKMKKKQDEKFPCFFNKRSRHMKKDYPKDEHEKLYEKMSKDEWLSDELPIPRVGRKGTRMTLAR
ncbi:hypothetical protein CR513_23531, partial [Mucuna pruriens]